MNYSTEMVKLNSQAFLDSTEHYAPGTESHETLQFELFEDLLYAWLSDCQISIAKFALDLDNDLTLQNVIADYVEDWATFRDNLLENAG
jgi:hypothetical protein